jgi:DNA mismatch repair ATPase MutL
MQKTLQFSVDSALLQELGEKLVETVHLALSELVKNAYDADATEVEVVFETTESGVERIKIIDNGTGMNFDSVQKLLDEDCYY